MERLKPDGIFSPLGVAVRRNGGSNENEKRKITIR